MKSFNNYNKYIILKGLEQKLIERFQNLNGKQVNECCGCCCGDAKCCEPTCSSGSTFIRFYSEYEVIDKLKTSVKVQDLFDLNRQFINKNFMYGGASLADTKIPLYFKEPGAIQVIVTPGNVQPTQIGTEHNAALYNFINNLLKKYNMGYPVVLTNSEGGIQLFFVKGCGTNGKEGSIKSSLVELAKMLDELDNMEEITWSQVLDASIDNLDDVYNFVVTCTIDINKFEK